MNYNGEQALSEYKREFIVKYKATVSTPPPRPLFGFPAYSRIPSTSRPASPPRAAHRPAWCECRWAGPSGGEAPGDEFCVIHASQHNPRPAAGVAFLPSSVLDPWLPPPTLRLLLTGVEGSHPCAVFALAAAPRAEAVKARHVLGAASRRRMARQSTSHRPPAPFERPSDAVAP